MVVRKQYMNLALLLACSFLPILAGSNLYSRFQGSPSGQETGPADGSGKLVPTDVLVFDRRGSFVSDLKRDQFELLVNGKRQPIVSFEQVSAGSVDEEKQWGRVQGVQAPASPATERNPEGGRTLFFFLDNFHMSASSIKLAREGLSRFIDSTTGSHDRLGLVAASRQIGFMQQVSNDRPALHAALEHLTVPQLRFEGDQHAHD